MKSKEHKYNIHHVGKNFTSNEGFKVKIINGGTKNHKVICTIYPDNDLEEYVCEREYGDIKRGNVKYPKKLYNELYFKKYNKPYGRYDRQYIGKKITSNQGYDVECIDGGTKLNRVKIRIKPKDKPEYITEVYTSTFYSRQVSYPYHPTLCGVGYHGVGRWGSKKHIKPYRSWSRMIKRCYGKDVYKTYNDVIVCPKWHNFQNFAEWYKDNYVDGYELDKDLLALPNAPKRYCNESCLFIPKGLNMFLASRDADGYHERYNGTFIASISRVDTGKREWLGTYNSPEKAHAAYLKAREASVLKWKERMYNEWKHYLESDDKLISGKYQRAIDNIR